MSLARSSTPSRRRGVPVNGHRVTYGRRFVGLGGGQAGAHCPIEPSPLCFHCPLSSPDGHPWRGFPGWMMDDGSSIAIRPRIRIRPGSTVDVLALDLAVSPSLPARPPRSGRAPWPPDTSLFTGHRYGAGHFSRPPLPPLPALSAPPSPQPAANRWLNHRGRQISAVDDPCDHASDGG